MSVWSLTLLDLSNNRLTGSLPPTFGLVFMYNYSIGCGGYFSPWWVLFSQWPPISCSEATMSSLVRYQALDLSGNRLSTTLPESLSSTQVQEDHRSATRVLEMCPSSAPAHATLQLIFFDASMS